MTQNGFKKFDPVDVNDVYVIHHGENICDNSSRKNEIDGRPLQPFARNDKFSRHDSIYLQQVPRISRCNVQFSFEGVYDNESSGDSIMPIGTLTNNNTQARNNANNEVSEYINLCAGFPLSCKLVLAIIGLVLVSGAIASWSMVLTNDKSSQGIQ